jgi:hypothetical protein
MSECKATSEWTINMSRDPNSTMLGTLFFRLKITAGTITGDVFVAGLSEPFSSVSGTCLSYDKPDITTMTLSFTWGKADVFLVGFTNFVDPVTFFRGKFIASAHAAIALLDNLPQVLAFAPDPGDTGTGTGQVT